MESENNISSLNKLDVISLEEKFGFILLYKEENRV